jgi:hypothetical protein
MTTLCERKYNDTKAYHEGADPGTTKQIISPAFSSFAPTQEQRRSAGRSDPGAL